MRTALRYELRKNRERRSAERAVRKWERADRRAHRKRERCMIATRSAAKDRETLIVILKNDRNES